MVLGGLLGPVDCVMGWTSPLVMSLIIGGIAVLIAFCYIETKVAEPMFRLSLFKIRPFTAGNVASLLSGLGRGGLMFILIIWLQGICLPMHGYAFEDTPLWAGIAMLPLTVGFLVAGPVSGYLSDRFGACPFATGGMLVAALLGYNPIQMLLGPVLTKLPASHAAYLTGHSFFPSLLSAARPAPDGRAARNRRLCRHLCVVITVTAAL